MSRSDWKMLSAKGLQIVIQEKVDGTNVITESVHPHIP